MKGSSSSALDRVFNEYQLIVCVQVSMRRRRRRRWRRRRNGKTKVSNTAHGVAMRTLIVCPSINEEEVVEEEAQEWLLP